MKHIFPITFLENGELLIFFFLSFVFYAYFVVIVNQSLKYLFLTRKDIFLLQEKSFPFKVLGDVR